MNYDKPVQCLLSGDFNSAVSDLSDIKDDGIRINAVHDEIVMYISDKHKTDAEEIAGIVDGLIVKVDEWIGKNGWDDRWTVYSDTLDRLGLWWSMHVEDNNWVIEARGLFKIHSTLSSQGDYLEASFWEIWNNRRMLPCTKHDPRMYFECLIGSMRREIESKMIMGSISSNSIKPVAESFNWEGFSLLVEENGIRINSINDLWKNALKVTGAGSDNPRIESWTISTS